MEQQPEEKTPLLPSLHGFLMDICFPEPLSLRFDLTSIEGAGCLNLERLQHMDAFASHCVLQGLLLYRPYFFQDKTSEVKLLM